MSQFYAVFGVVFLGILSLGRNADVNNFASDAKQEPNGFVPVNSVSSGYPITICSGALFKFWMVLTTAECVFNEKISDLSVDVTYWKFRRICTSTVNVSDVIFDPGFKEGSTKDNRALLVIRGNIFWLTNAFILPTEYYSPEVIIENQLEVFQNRFKSDGTEKVPGPSTTIFVNVTLDYTKCNETTAVPHWYCAEMGEENDVFNKFDIGSPFFIQNGCDRTLLAIYTGKNMEGRGHIYESIYTTFTWIQKISLKHIALN